MTDTDSARKTPYPDRIRGAVSDAYAGTVRETLQRLVPGMPGTDCAWTDVGYDLPSKLPTGRLRRRYEPIPDPFPFPEYFPGYYPGYYPGDPLLKM